MTAKQKRDKYKHDQDYREHVRSQREKWHKSESACPYYRELVRLRKRIYGVREGISSMMARVAKRERLLLQLVKDRDAVRAKWIEKKKLKKGVSPNV